MMLCLQMLFLILLIGTVHAQAGPRSYVCPDSGCQLQKQLTFATRADWTLAVQNLKSGYSPENALYGSGNEISFTGQGRYCMKLDSGSSFQAITISFSIRFGVFNKRKAVLVYVDGDKQYSLKTPGDNVDWRTFTRDLTSNCGTIEVCILAKQPSWLKNFYLQTCTQAPTVPTTPAPTTPEPSICMDSTLTNYGSTVSGLPNECPSSLSALPGSLEFEPHVTLNLTNVHKVTFNCLDANGNVINSDVQVMSGPGTYTVMSGNIGKCYEVQVVTEWYTGDAFSVENVDVTVCAASNHLLYIACEDTMLTTLPPS